MLHPAPGVIDCYMPKRGAMRVASATTISIVKFSAKQLQQQFAKQKERRKLEIQLARAQAAARKFRPRKVERNSIVFIGLKGERGVAAKGRKGYAVYVDSKGRKKLMSLRKAGLRPVYLSEVDFQNTKGTKTARKKFIASQRKLTARGSAVIKSKGIVKPSGPYDFSDKVVKKIARSLKKSFDSQVSQRRFLVNALVLIKLPDGSTRVYNIQVPIAKPDHIAIAVGGMENFVKLKFYAFLARELAFDGYVTAGSANHVRRLKQNKGLPKSQWTQRDGEKWRSNENEIVRIERIEWKIEQMI